jgi:hypothetical protein
MAIPGFWVGNVSYPTDRRRSGPGRVRKISVRSPARSYQCAWLRGIDEISEAAIRQMLERSFNDSSNHTRPLWRTVQNIEYGQHLDQAP